MNPSYRRHPQCTATAKQTEAQCKNQAEPGRTVCRFHGGRVPRGIALPQTLKGRYSKVFPTEIMAGYEASKEDPDLLSMQQELHALDGMITARESRLGTGASARHLQQSRRLVEAIRQAQRVNDREAIDRNIVELIDHIDRGGSEEDAQEEVIRLYERRARLADAEQRHLMAIGSTMTMEQALILMHTWEDIICRYVTDPEALLGVERELAAIVEGQPLRTR
jgi:hypothetical protein